MVDSASITHVILSDKKTCQKSHTEVVIFVEFVEESGVNFFCFEKNLKINKTFMDCQIEILLRLKNFRDVAKR